MKDASRNAAGKRATAVSMTKAGGPATGPVGRPREAVLAFLALVVAAVGTLIGSLSLFGLTGWLRYQLAKSYTDGHKGKHLSAHDLATEVHNAKFAAGEQSVLVVLAIGFTAYGVYRGRYWSRWATIGLWALGSFLTQMIYGVFNILSIAANVPIAYKGPAFVAAVAMLAAIVLVNMRAVVSYLGAGRPVRGTAGQRRGLFGTRPSPALRTRTPDATTPTSSSTSSTSSSTSSSSSSTAAVEPAGAKPDRSRSKTRVETAAVAKGAELARTRAKAASKSRRRADV